MHKVTISLRLPTDLIDKLDEFSTRSGRTRSNAVQTIIEEYFEPNNERTIAIQQRNEMAETIKKFQDMLEQVTESAAEFEKITKESRKRRK